MDIKGQGQVFTPNHLVEDILDIANYKGDAILKKHVIENSCGNGNFIIGFIKRYRDAYIEKYKTIIGLEIDLEKYIHGIEKDKIIYNECMDNLNKFTKENNFKKIKWDIIEADALHTVNYNNKMDYVIGNPPYVRVHNLKEQYDQVKEYSFCKTGMTDSYIMFFEIGFKMLNKNGILCYITPNSFCSSLAGTELRKYFLNHKNLEALYDLGHYQPFGVSTYTIISKVVNNKKFDLCKYYKYDKASMKPIYICDIKYNDLFNGNKIILTTNKNFHKHLNYDITVNARIKVKNGFATLNDKVFIQDDFNFKENTIDIIKASTGKFKKCIFPYNNMGKLLPFNMLNIDVQNYLLLYKHNLLKANKKEENLWYGFGRSQALKDVYKNKISINTTIKDIKSIKINQVEKGIGIYSGLYILSDIPISKIKSILCTEKFIEYLKVINKCKSGGYYTFSSNDLSKFLNCELEDYYE